MKANDLLDDEARLLARRVGNAMSRLGFKDVRMDNNTAVGLLPLVNPAESWALEPEEPTDEATVGVGVQLFDDGEQRYTIYVEMGLKTHENLFQRSHSTFESIVGELQSLVKFHRGGA